MKSLILFQLFCVFLISDLARADHQVQSSAEDAVYNQLVRAGAAADPLDSLAYSILLRHMKRRPSSHKDPAPQISSYFVVDTSAKREPASFETPNSFSSLDTKDLNIDYPPLEYELSKDYHHSVSKSHPDLEPEEITTTTSKTTTQSTTQPAPPELDTFVDTVPKSLEQPQQEYDTFASSSIRNSRPHQIQLAHPQLSGSFASMLRKKIPQKVNSEHSFENGEDYETQTYQPQLHQLAQHFEDQFVNYNDETQAQTPQPYVDIDAFEDNYSHFEEQSHQPLPPKTKLIQEFSTAPVLDIPRPFQPVKVEPVPTIRPEMHYQSSPESQTVKYSDLNEIRSSLRQKLRLKKPTSNVRASSAENRPTLAISKTFDGYNENTEARSTTPRAPVTTRFTTTYYTTRFTSPSPKSKPTKPNYAQKPQVVKVNTGDSDDIQKAVELLAKFSDDFVSHDSHQESQHIAKPITKPTPKPIVTEKIKGKVVKNSIDVKKGLHVVNPPARFQYFESTRPTSKPIAIKNKIPIVQGPLPFPVRFFSPPTKNYPLRQAFSGSKQTFSTIRFKTPGDLSGPELSYQSNTRTQPAANVRGVQAKDPYRMNTPLGYEIFKSVVREMR